MDLGSMLYFLMRFETASQRAPSGLKRNEISPLIRTGQCDGVDILAVIDTGHVLLAEAYGVLALGDIVEDFEFFL